jgi:hypothetical protein
VVVMCHIAALCVLLLIVQPCVRREGSRRVASVMYDMYFLFVSLDSAHALQRYHYSSAG